MEIELIDFIKGQFAEIGLLAAAVVLAAQGVKDLFKLKDKILFTVFGHDISFMYIIAFILSAVAGVIGNYFEWGIYEGSTIWGATILTVQVWIGATFGWDHLRDWLKTSSKSK